MNFAKIRARFYAALHENDERIAKTKPGTKERLQQIMKSTDICEAYVKAFKHLREL